MSAFFLDSSALVKRYVVETGTAWIQALAAPHTGNKLIIARITWVEVLNALSRRQREGNLSPASVTKFIRTFRYDLDMQYQVIEMDRTLAEVAGQLIGKNLYALMTLYNWPLHSRSSPLLSEPSHQG